MQNRPFSICNDGCSDSGIKKMNPVCVNIFDAKNSSELQTKFYDMFVTTGVDCSKSETLFNAINDKFVKDDIPWQNVISVGLDNTSCNIGIRNSVKSRILQKNPDCIRIAVVIAIYPILQLLKVVLHITKKLVSIFKKSSRRKGILTNYTEYVGCEKWGEITQCLL